jgi:zinc D-Ala-D-Ala carboxypeptidase
MAGLLATLTSIAAAGTLMVSSAVNEAAPQNDPDGVFLVNRQWRISEDYVPELRMADVTGQVRRLRPDAATALEEMYAAAKEEIGVTLTSISGYRSYSKQQTIYKNKLTRVNGSYAKADEYVARPGASEHQLGLAMDVGQKNSKTGLSAKFADTRGGQWLAENCYRFGFILRYQADWEDITGYKYESWHVRYVGKELSMSIKEANVPLETYLLSLREETLMNIVK